MSLTTPNKNISSSLNRIERTQLAQTVIDTVSSGYDDNTGLISSNYDSIPTMSTYTFLTDLGFGQNANLLSAMAIHDAVISRRDNYKTMTEQYLLTVPRLIPQT